MKKSTLLFFCLLAILAGCESVSQEDIDAKEMVLNEDQKASMEAAR